MSGITSLGKARGTRTYKMILSEVSSTQNSFSVSLEPVSDSSLWFPKVVCNYAETHIHCPVGLHTVGLMYNSDYPTENVACRYSGRE